MMRTTLDIDEDVLGATKELAKRMNLSAGQVVSQLLRRVLTGQEMKYAASPQTIAALASVTGFQLFPAGRAMVTNETINRLRDAEGV